MLVCPVDLDLLETLDLPDLLDHVVSLEVLEDLDHKESGEHLEVPDLVVSLDPLELGEDLDLLETLEELGLWELLVRVHFPFCSCNFFPSKLVSYLIHSRILNRDHR